MRRLLIFAFCATCLGQSAPTTLFPGTIGNTGGLALRGGIIVSTSGSSHTLIPFEWWPLSLKITGTATTIVAPLNQGQSYIVTNGESGSITFGGASGMAVTIGAGQTVEVICPDGANYTTNDRVQTAAVNYPFDPALGGNYNYNAAWVKCFENLLPSDNGALSQSTCLSLPQDFDYSPGWNNGNPGVGVSISSFVHNSFQINQYSYAAAIHNGINLDQNVYSSGDINALAVNVNASPARIAGSDEGVHLLKESYSEAPEFFATVGSTSGNTLTLTGATNQNMGLNRPAIDLTSEVVSGNISSIGAVGGSYPQVATAVTDFTVVASSIGTLSATVSVPSSPNPTLQLASASVTVNIAISSGSIVPSTGTLIQFMGVLPEVVKPTAVSVVGGGVYTITATFIHSHAIGETVAVGGAVGSYLEQTNFTASGYRYLETVFASPSAHLLWVGYQSQAGLIGLSKTFAGPVNMYQGGETIGVLNPSTGKPDGTTLVLEPNAAAFSPGDSIEVTNHISAELDSNFEQDVLYSPFAGHHYWTIGNQTIGGGLDNSTGVLLYTNSVAASQYTGGGGKYFAPTLIQTLGVTGGGIANQYAPLIDGTAVGATGCARGWAYCTAGLAPGATSTFAGLYDSREGSVNYYDYATHSFVWQVHAAGTQLTIDANGIHAPKIAAGNGFTGSAVAAGCTLTIVSGIITATSGC